MILKNTSASQVEAYTACPRLWHFGWVRGFKAPQTLAMQRGSFIHEGAEHAVKKAHELAMKARESGLSAIANLKLDDDLLLLDNDFAPYVKAMLPYLPLGKEKVLVEQKIVLRTAPGLPPWIGYIDLLDDSRTFSEYLRIVDHKTRSDFRYASTPEELKNNSQVISYAKYAFEEGHDEEFIEVGHLNVKTATKTPKKPKVLPMFTLVNQPQVEEVWARDLVLVEEMVRAAEITNTDLLEPKGTSNGQCKKYGGCPHRQRCGISIQNHLSATNKPNNFTQKGNGTPMSTSFLDRVKAAKAAAGGAPATTPAPTPKAAPATKPVPVAAKPTGVPAKASNGAGKPATGVIPSDASPRTTPVKARTAPPVQAPEPEVEGDGGDDAAEPTGNAERIEAGRAAAPVKPTPRAAKKPAAATPSGFILFIDCTLTKDLNGTQVTLFEDWVGPVHVSLAEYAEEKGIASWWQLPYAEQKMTMGQALSARVQDGAMPDAIAIMSKSPGATDALDVLIPHAKMVIRGL